MTSPKNFVGPKWAREIERFLGVKSQFILCGNIHDIYPIPTDEAIGAGNLTQYLEQLLKTAGYSFLLHYEPHTVSVVFGETEVPPNLLKQDFSQGSVSVTLTDLANMVGHLTDGPGREKPGAMIINYASRLPSLCRNDAEIADFQYNLFRYSINSQPRQGRFNLIFWVMDKENDLPAWYSLDNPRVRVLPIAKPDHESRRNIVAAIASTIPGFSQLSENSEDREKFINAFVDQTGGLFATEILSIGRLAHKDGLDCGKIGDAIRQYKLGVPDNPWDKLNRTTITEGFQFLANRVIGQNQAVTHSLDIIKRSIFDLSGAQFSQSLQRPKGVIFFAGPTGVGKTELAKSITELVFGSSSNYIRFDMSEFNQEHSDQRLIGAPPGYVGYDTGGELTNAIKQNPFSLILFDEIEKAHPKILDIFLQILDDGRLTSGRGETVYFSDAVLVFTSNLGLYRQNSGGEREARITPEMDYSKIKQELGTAIADYFRFALNRPEILNRLGNNIVAFDFIREKESRLIFDKMLKNVLGKLQETHKIFLQLDDVDREALADLTCHDLSMGGRGIGNALEEHFVNPLARELFAVNAESGQRYRCHLTIESDKVCDLKLALMLGGI